MPVLTTPDIRRSGSAAEVSSQARTIPIRMALAGNPNVGKSTLFNHLTGLSQHTGNWPGKTVEKREGLARLDDFSLQITDLPGMYSLTPFSVEERIARDYILHEKPDVVVVVVDATHLERNLSFLLEVLEMTQRVVLALNMADLAEKEGLVLDLPVLQERLGISVVALSAARGRGVDSLLRAVVQTASRQAGPGAALPYGEAVEQALIRIQESLGKADLQEWPIRWAALRLLEGDPEITQVVVAALPEALEVGRALRAERDWELELADRRYDLAVQIARAGTVQTRAQGVSATERIDGFVLNRFLAIPLLVAVVYTVFKLTFTLSDPAVGLVESFFGWLGEGAATSMGGWAPEWAVSLVVDGLIGGVGAFMVFVPLLLSFFALYSLMEESGYLARAAFVADRILGLMGLHGKALFSLMMGFGCNIPGIMAARTLENEKDRLITVLVNSFVPCSARLGVMALVTAAFFPSAAATWVLMSLMGLSFAVIMLTAKLLRRFALPGEPQPFIMELPPYRVPLFRRLGTRIGKQLLLFVQKAGTVILLASLIIWALSSLPPGVELEESLVGRLGRLLAPIGEPLEFDWRIMVALFFGFVAKETSMTTLGVLYGLSSKVGEEALRGALVGAWSPVVAITFLAVQMLYVPCLTTVSVIRKETGSWRWTVLAVGYSLLVAYLVGLVITGAGRLLA